MAHKVRLTQSILRNIQKTFKLKRQTIHAKVGVLLLQWNKILTRMNEVAAHIGDNFMLEVIAKIFQVPKAIKM